MQNNGIINSDGQSVGKESCSNGSGSGAGSGGSVQIYIGESIIGKGKISANGGDSWDYCGEGGGGRMMVFRINWENLTAMSMNADKQNWNGDVSVKKGDRMKSMNLSELENKNFAGANGSN